LRYLAETAAPHPVATTMVAQLKQVQDAIGTWHDWLTLTARAEQVLGDVPSDPLLAAMRARIERQLEKALAVTARAGRRLERLRLAGSRKGARPVTAARPTTAMRSAGASA
jgi:CHAD domain-containing protein